MRLGPREPAVTPWAPSTSGHGRLWAWLAICLLVPSSAWASSPPSGSDSNSTIEVNVDRDKQALEHPGRASEKRTQEQWEAQHAQSAPDALRHTPGVYIQQSSHAQASPYLRGLTGQRTVILFDGIRLNNSTYRQGPNQYFFTVDHHSIRSIEVLRGSASTRFGSGALGGAILSMPLRLEPDAPDFRASLITRTHSADQRMAARAQIGARLGPRLSLIAGAGWREVGQLQTAGPVRSLADGSPHKSPSFAPDQRTQLGTGFTEWTGDARLGVELGRGHKLSVAHYSYRQRDAPRTDKCPPEDGRAGECLVYKKQDRDLSYIGLDSALRSTMWKRLQVRLSLSRQHEWRQWFLDNLLFTQPGGTLHDGRDTVWTQGMTFSLQSQPLKLGQHWQLLLQTGADSYFDQLQSGSKQTFTDTQEPVVLLHSRGQYVDGARYLTSGAWAQSTLRFRNRLWLESGARAALVYANSPADPSSDTRAVDQTQVPLAAHLGLHWRILGGLRWQNNLDRGFRAPNLDDLTGRQQVGPGFQFENHALRPETTWSLESGFRWVLPRADLSLFGFGTRIDQAITRAPRNVDECPSSQKGPEGCLASTTRFSLVNLRGPAQLWGVEASAALEPLPSLKLQSSLSYAFGQGPSPLPNQDRMLPLSRVPPMHGHLALQHRPFARRRHAFSWGATLEWARAQTRLALSDRADARIPIGGTPGYVVTHLQLGWVITRHADLGLMLENLFDTPYRLHGSSVNGAGRSIRARLRLHASSPRRSSSDR